MDRIYPVLFLAQLTTLVEQFVTLIRSEQAAIIRVTRWVWLVAGWALIYVVATSDHLWMVWRGEAATRASATIMRLAARDISLSAFVNYIWSIVFIFVAIAAIWGSIKALLHRVRRIPTAAHA